MILITIITAASKRPSHLAAKAEKHKEHRGSNPLSS